MKSIFREVLKVPIPDDQADRARVPVESWATKHVVDEAIAKLPKDPKDPKSSEK